jgi:HAD superfamily hydrolase (TIGR01450 family)
MEKEKLPKYVFLDLDQTVWKKNRAIPGVPEAITKVKKMGVQVKILSNSTDTDRKGFVKKLVKCGICDITKEDIFSSSYACALLMKQIGIESALVVGPSSLKKEIKKQGIIAHKLSSYDGTVIDAIAISKYEGFCFDTLKKVCTIYRKLPGVMLFGTNPVRGKSVYCSGAVISTIEQMTGQKALYTGKPSSELMDILTSELNTKPEEMMMIGDRIPIDVKFGAMHGVKTVLVLTGADRYTNIDEVPESDRPTYVLPSLADLPKLFNESFQK